jgi:hypothetical protein
MLSFGYMSRKRGSQRGSPMQQLIGCDLKTEPKLFQYTPADNEQLHVLPLRK